MSLLKPFKLGSVTLPSNILCSPLAGCSDYPFRKMSARYKPGLIYCEMVKMDALIRNDPGTYHLLDYSTDMHPIGGQLVGSDPKLAAEAARILEGMGFDVIDLNWGCPVDKVTKDGCGSGLLRNPQRIGDILANMVAAVKIPVTVKVRAGWDDTQINAAEITEIAEAAGAQAIAVHGRTRAQAYRGPANWAHIKAAKEASKGILVFGNGDVFDGAAAERMFRETGCDAVLVSRGTMGQPWIVQDIERHLSGLAPVERSTEDLRQHLLDHFEEILLYHPEKRAVVDMRRVGCWYIKKNKEFRHAISRAERIEDVRRLLLELSLEKSQEMLACHLERYSPGSIFQGYRS